MSSIKNLCIEFSRTINHNTAEVALAASLCNDDEAFTEAFKSLLDMWQARISVFKDSLENQQTSPAPKVDKATVCKAAAQLIRFAKAVKNSPSTQNIACLGKEAMFTSIACDRFLNG